MPSRWECSERLLKRPASSFISKSMTGKALGLIVLLSCSQLSLMGEVFAGQSRWQGSFSVTRSNQEQGQRPISSPAEEPEEAKSRTLVDLALADLSKRLGMPASLLEVRKVESVAWPDTSLGCPKPGMFYAQVITPGFRIILASGMRVFEYHTDRNRRVVRCEEKESIPRSSIEASMDPGDR